MERGLVRAPLWHLRASLEMRWPTDEMLDDWPFGGKVPLRGHRQRMVVQSLRQCGGSVELGLQWGVYLRHHNFRNRFLGLVAIVSRLLYARLTRANNSPLVQ